MCNFVRVTPIEAVVIDGHDLAPVTGLGEAGAASSIEAHSVIIGFHIPFLPDFLTDFTLIGSSDEARVVEILDRQTQLIHNLWKWRSGAFALRYVYVPDQPWIDMFLLARVLTLPGRESEAVEQLARDLSQLFHVYGISLTQMNQAPEHALINAVPEAPAAVRSTEQRTLHVVEVRQHEDLAYLPWIRGEVYMVQPYWRAAGTMIPVFASLMQQNAPCAINLHIEPTKLTTTEIEALTRAAALAQTATDMQRSTYSTESNSRLADPQAGLVAQVYRRQLQRLTRPFAIAAQVASPSKYTAVSLAATLGTAFAASDPFHRSDDEYSGSYDIVYPETEQDYASARRVLHDLVLVSWGQTLAEESPDLLRLRYLADARGATALFRYPISVRGGIPGIPVRQPTPDYDMGRRDVTLPPDTVHLGYFRSGGNAVIGCSELTRHGLVSGLPGSGKTNTCLHILNQVHRLGIPFLVLEPAKTEYRGLIDQSGFSDLLVFTLGDETTAPIRINPFELLPGIRLEVHMEALNTAINAAMPQFGVLPSIIEEALEAVYARHGWRLVDTAQEDEDRLFPMMLEFYREAVRTVDQRGYRGELQSNIRAAVKGRIGSLLRGSKGKMFNCRRSFPPEVLFERPVVLEMDSLSDDSKSLTILFLLILLREYRQARSRATGVSSGELSHLLLIEEAHRVLENVSSVSNPEVAPDTRARAVRSVASLLVEMRSYGQGILIAEQSPEKLASDAVRNTNLKIGHMLPGRQDREALASAMMMDEQQERYLGRLAVGQAAFFKNGMEKASFIAVPPFKQVSNYADFLPDKRVRKHMQGFYTEFSTSMLPFNGCRFCTQPCQHRELVEPITRNRHIAKDFRSALIAFEERPEPIYWSLHWKNIARVCCDAVADSSVAADAALHAAYCFLAHEIDFPVTEHMRLEFERAINTLFAASNPDEKDLADAS